MSKVLMIEDEEDIVRFFDLAFQNIDDLQFLTALGAREGVEIARRERPEVIIVDLRMPGLSGEDALKEIKAFLPEAKYVVLTAWIDGETEERIKGSIGVDAYFEKPANLEQVIAKVMELLGR